ncbi:MAG: hypothetical protein KAT05_04805, partial [Spirochaetes bacterium]|nr:hypothetical protein [Spirochaetota bacterium]
DIIYDLIKHLEYSNFHLLLYMGDENQIEEVEILSKNRDEFENMNENICAVIRQARIDIDEPYYFLFYNNTKQLIKDHIIRYNDYKKLCLEQYRNSFSGTFPYLLKKDLTKYDEVEIKKVVKHLLIELMKSKEKNIHSIQ